MTGIKREGGGLEENAAESAEKRRKSLAARRALRDLAEARLIERVPPPGIRVIALDDARGGGGNVAYDSNVAPPPTPYRQQGVSPSVASPLPLQGIASSLAAAGNGAPSAPHAAAAVNSQHQQQLLALAAREAAAAATAAAAAELLSAQEAARRTEVAYARLRFDAVTGISFGGDEDGDEEEPGKEDDVKEAAVAATPPQSPPPAPTP